jgi:hypothetical protein
MLPRRRSLRQEYLFHFFNRARTGRGLSIVPRRRETEALVQKRPSVLRFPPAPALRLGTASPLSLPANQRRASTNLLDRNHRK